MGTSVWVMGEVPGPQWPLGTLALHTHTHSPSHRARHQPDPPGSGTQEQGWHATGKPCIHVSDTWPCRLWLLMHTTAPPLPHRAASRQWWWCPEPLPSGGILVASTVLQCTESATVMRKRPRAGQQGPQREAHFTHGTGASPATPPLLDKLPKNINKGISSAEALGVPTPFLAGH